MTVPTLVLSRIGFDARHGATAAERSSSRRFEVDVEIEAALERPQSSDRLEDTIDYRTVAETILQVGTAAEPCHLIEALARQMLDALAERIPHAAFRLELRKLNPPDCPGAPEYAAVRLSRPARS